MEMKLKCFKFNIFIFIIFNKYILCTEESNFRRICYYGFYFIITISKDLIKNLIEYFSKIIFKKMNLLLNLFLQHIGKFYCNINKDIAYSLD